MSGRPFWLNCVIVFPLSSPLPNNSLNLLSMQLVNQEATVSIPLNEGAFCDESSSWLLRAADAQKKAGELKWKCFFGASVPPSLHLTAVGRIDP